MSPTKKTSFALLLFSACHLLAQGQSRSPGNKINLVFSAVKGMVSKPDSLTLPSGAASTGWMSGDTSYFKVIGTGKKQLRIGFMPAADFTGVATASLEIKDKTGERIAEIDMTGLVTNGLEGANEPTLDLLTKALGYKINIGWTGLANHTRPELQGDELAPCLFRKAGKGQVDMIPVARYSPDFELAFGYYTGSGGFPEKHPVGVLAKAGVFPENQCILPAVASGRHSFDPGQASFGFYATGPSHTAYSEDVWNMLLYPQNAVRAARVYPIKDATGKSIPNNYLLCFEEAKNGDYNDYVFVVKNIVPELKDPFVTLFDGKNLHGWYTYLKDYGRNADPNHNFRIEDSALHVIGKDLGYVITEKGYKNFDLRVDFKWGIAKWPPREDAKRDGGICYNIPVQAMDSIWPTSIECQIQEGDVGDFWLLGFSTIRVNGTETIPSNHTRAIKLADAERATGEWNTVEVISYNGKCVQVVNGVVVNVGENASTKEGKILLQSEFSEIYYRNVRIRKL